MQSNTNLFIEPEDTTKENYGRFTHPNYTADGSERASVSLENPNTLWFNTGTLCNIECNNCYIKSSPTNDSLVYITAEEVSDYLRQVKTRKWPVTEIGLTGGEPFMNPEILGIIESILQEGYNLLILTNAMRPMMRPRIQEKLLELNKTYNSQLIFRVSLDHYDEIKHDQLRGKGGFKISLLGLDWLSKHSFTIAIAGRMHWKEDENSVRQGFRELFESQSYNIDPDDSTQLVLFPEMDVNEEVPEITVDCWDILGKKPSQMMCATSRMIVKRKYREKPSVVSCTLLPYEEEFDLGESLEEAEKTVFLNHTFCAQFCVLGEASCSPKS